MVIEKDRFYFRVFTVIFWIAMTWGFITDDIFPFLEVVRPPLYLFLDVVLFVLGIATLRQRGDVVVFLSYVVLAFVSTVLVNHLSVMHFVNGSRDFFGIILVVPILRYFFMSPFSKEFRESVDKQLYVLLWLQGVCIVWQFIRYGAGDHGGGTLGFGGSGIASMLIYMLSFYFISKKWDSEHFLQSLVANKKYVLLLIPTFLNETKASFILLTVYFLLLLRFDRKAVIRLLLAVPIFIGAFIGVVTLYMNVTNQQADEVFSKDFVTNYLYGENLEDLAEIGMMVQDGDFDMDARNWWEEDIPRFGKIALVIPMLQDSPGGLMLGVGVGQFKGGTMVDRTEFYKENQWLLFGSKIWLFSLLVQLGISGVIWFMIVICRDLFPRHSHMRMHRQVLFYLAACLGLIMLYNDSIREFYFCAVLFYLALSLKYSDDASKATDAAGALSSEQAV